MNCVNLFPYGAFCDILVGVYQVISVCMLSVYVIYINLSPSGVFYGILMGIYQMICVYGV